MTKAVNETAKTAISAGVIDTKINPNQCLRNCLMSRMWQK